MSVLPQRRPRVLALLDAAAILAFSVVGMLSHDALSARGFLRDAVPLLAGWFGAAIVVGTYRRRSLATLLAAWAIGIPAGVGIRALVLGRALDGGQAAFLATTLVFTLVFVLGLRLASARAAR